MQDIDFLFLKITAGNDDNKRLIGGGEKVNNYKTFHETTLKKYPLTIIYTIEK